MMNLVEELKWRGLQYQITDPELEKELNEGCLTFYLGADPTADSLHIGHLLAYLVAKRLEQHGHRPILVIGGGTGLIGDPSFKENERQLLSIEESMTNAEGIIRQVKKLLPNARIVNNYDWLSGLNAIEFLRDIGKHFNISYMIAKESVKSRIETGLSFTEFAYQIIQAWDFEYLFANHQCQLQIGGQDQWGNITSGMELIRKIHGIQSKTYGFTFPLVTKTDGSKFGKSESGNVWLDPVRTSPYEFYQFWINTADADVISRLKQFTFLSVSEIEVIERAFIDAPHVRMAQKVLAQEVTTLVHGSEKYLEAKKISEALFSGEMHTLSASMIEMACKDLINLEIASSIDIVDALIQAKIAPSKREARQLISSGAITLNGVKITDVSYVLEKKDAIEGIFYVIRKGKKSYSIIRQRIE